MTATTTPDQRRALMTNNTIMLLYGISAVLIGPTLPGMVTDFDLSLSAAGLVGSLQSAGGIVGAILCLLIADRVSHPKAAVVSFVLVAVSLLAVGLAGSYVVVVAAFAASGVFVRLLDVMLNAHTGEIVRGDSGRPMSTLHMFFSIGAFLGPMVARALMSAGVGWSQVYLIVAAGYLVAMLVALPFLQRYTAGVAATSAVVAPGVAPVATSSDGQTSGAACPRRLSVRAVIVILGPLLFFYAVHQVGVTAWLPYYLETSRGAGANFAGVGLSLYWVGIIAGRYISSRLVNRSGPAPLLIIGCLLSAVASVLAVLVANPVVAGGFFVLAGLTSGATIPLAYSLAFGLIHGKTGGITSILVVITLGGRLLSPWLIGSVAELAGLITAMLIPALVLFLSAALGLVLVTLTRAPG